MSFKSQQNKLSQEFNNAETNKNNVANLPLIKVSSNTATYNNKQREITLADRQYITGTTIEVFEQFYDLDDTFLNFLIPVAFLETDEAFVQYTDWTFFNYNTWQKYTSGAGTVTILKMHVDGFLLTPLPGGGFTSSIAPIYVTAKIKILNPNIRVEITNSKK